MENLEQDPLTWGYWSSHESEEDQAASFERGEAIARRCLAFQSDNLKLLLHIIADIRDQGRFSEIERGFISLLAHRARFGAKPMDLDSFAEHMMGDDRTRFVDGMEIAIEESSHADPYDVVERIATSIEHRDHAPKFAGYVTAIVFSAIACLAH